MIQILPSYFGQSSQHLVTILTKTDQTRRIKLLYRLKSYIIKVHRILERRTYNLFLLLYYVASSQCPQFFIPLNRWMDKTGVTLKWTPSSSWSDWLRVKSLTIFHVLITLFNFNRTDDGRTLGVGFLLSFRILFFRFQTNFAVVLS